MDSESIQDLLFYSEYIDFKRAKFVHVSTEFEKGTNSEDSGRINCMKFKAKK